MSKLDTTMLSKNSIYTSLSNDNNSQHILFIIGQCNNRMLLEKLVHTFIIGLRHVKIESYLCFETLNTGVFTCLHKDQFELSGKLEFKL